MNKSNLFENIPPRAQTEFFDIIAENKHIKIERIVSAGHSSAPSDWYNQEQNEWVVLLSGSATLSFEKADDIQLQPGDHILIPAHTKHRLKHTSPDEETIWIAVHFKS